MPFGAMRLCPIIVPGSAAPDILKVGDRLQVVRIAAKPVPADMVTLKPFGYGADR
jgi:hypothetical protein